MFVQAFLARRELSSDMNGGLGEVVATECGSSGSNVRRSVSGGSSRSRGRCVPALVITSGGDTLLAHEKSFVSQRWTIYKTQR